VSPLCCAALPMNLAAQDIRHNIARLG